MQLEKLAYIDLFELKSPKALANLRYSLLNFGIVAISGVPDYVRLAENYIEAARNLAKLPESIKQQVAPDRDKGQTEGYELGAEWFKDSEGNWKIDDKKSSYYAYVPDRPINQWIEEIDFKKHYLALGELIFEVGKKILAVLELDEAIGLNPTSLTGYGRMLHYLKEDDSTNGNPDWCGAHFDHSLITGLLPAYYYRDGVEVTEPCEAGLYIIPTHQQEYVKIDAADKSLLLFQVGEFGQLVSNDHIRATRHKVKKAEGGIERYTFALFFSPKMDYTTRSKSKLTSDPRYSNHCNDQGELTFGQWETATYDLFRAKPELHEESSA